MANNAKQISVKLRSLPDHTVLENTKTLVQKERENTICVLHHLREVDKRRLYNRLGYKSLWEYCIKELRYSESAAHRRISSMRLLCELPAMELKLNTGELSLTSFARAASFFKQEAKSRTDVSIEKKAEILNSIAGKSSTETERQLISLSTQPLSAFKERIRVVNERTSEIGFFASQDLVNDLEQLKGLLAHKHRSLTMAELIAIMAQIALDKLDPARQPVRRRTSAAEVVPKRKEPRFATPRQRKLIFRRAHGRCTWRNPKTGQRCDSRYMLQMDHIEPYAKGGKSTINNLRLLCAEHNRLYAAQSFGRGQSEAATKMMQTHLRCGGEAQIPRERHASAVDP